MPVLYTQKIKLQEAHITVTKILKCFMTKGCRKWSNGLKIEKFAALTEYLEQQRNCNRYKRKISNSRLWRNQSYSTFFFKHIKTMPWNYQNLVIVSEWHWKDAFNFTEIVNNFKVKRKKQYVKLWNSFPTFLWNYTYNFENILTAWS